MSQRYLPGLVVGVGHHIDYKTLSIVLALNWSTETKLAKKTMVENGYSLLKDI